MKAAEELLANGGVIDGDLSVLNGKKLFKKSKKKVFIIADEEKEKDEKKDEAFKRIAGDISMVDDDHLDLTLTQEEIFLNQYLSLLEKE